MNEIDKETQTQRVLAAEWAWYTAQLAYDMTAATFDVASRALTDARTNLMNEQQKLVNLVAAPNN